MPSRHGSDHSHNSPPSLLYTMSDMDITPSQHPSLTNLERYDMYDATPPSTSGFGDSSAGGMPVRPKRKQVKNACSACQRACKRCDVGRPCERCIKYGMAETCRDSQRKERKKGIKRGPYKKRDGESVVPPDPEQSAHYLPGMVNDHLQRMSPKRMSRVPSVAEVDLSAPNLIPIDVDPVPNQSQTQAVPLRIPSLPVRPDAQYPYDTQVIIPPSLNHTHTPPLSLAGIQHQQYQPHQSQHYSNSNTHPQASSSYPHSEEYYSTRYDHPTHAPARPAHFRIDETGSQSSHHQDYSRHVQQPIQDYTRSPPIIHYPSPEQSPPRERQYSSTVYQDTSSRHSMVHPDSSYQTQSDSMAHDHETHDTRVIDPYYAAHQQHHQRSYSSESHMHDVQQQDHQQQQPYYSNYNAYQPSSTSYGSSQQQQYGYSQSHVSQQQVINASQSDAGYSQHLSYASTGSSSMNAYPTQPHHQVDNTVVPLQYPSVRSPIKIARGSIDASASMVAHPHHSHHPQHHQHHSQHVGNVQIQSN